MNHQYTQYILRRIASFLVLLLGVIFVLPVSAHAQEVPAVTNPISGLRSFTSKEVIKKYGLDLAARIIAKGIIANLNKQVVGWIQGNDSHGQSNVGFVANLQQEFRNTADFAGSEFLDGIKKDINLCGRIGPFLNIRLQHRKSPYPQFACTVTGVKGNLKNFYENFRNGGWSSFIQVSLEPQNDPYSALLMAYDAKLKAESDATHEIGQTLLSSKGQFKGFRVENKRCVKTPVTGADENGNTTYQLREDCFTEHVTKTPGSVVADTLSTAIGSGYRFTEVADEINEAIASIANALIGKLIASGEGLFNHSLQNAPEGGLENLNSPAFIDVGHVLIGAAGALSRLNTNITGTQTELFTMRADLDAFAHASPAPIGIDLLIEEKNRPIHEKENALAASFDQKNGFIDGMRDFLGFIRAAAQNTDDKAVAELINQLPGKVQNFLDLLRQASFEVPSSPDTLTATVRDTIEAMRTEIDSERAVIQGLLTEIDNITTHIQGGSSSASARQALIASRPALASQLTPLENTRGSLASLSGTIMSASSDEETARRIASASLDLISAENVIQTALTTTVTVHHKMDQFWKALYP